MCWAVPARVVEVEGLTAKVDFGGGAVRTVIVAYDDVKVGDVVLVHAGAIIGKVKPEELLETLKLYTELAVELAVQSGMSREEAEKQVSEQLAEWRRWVEEIGGRGEG